MYSTVRAGVCVKIAELGLEQRGRFVLVLEGEGIIITAEKGKEK